MAKLANLCLLFALLCLAVALSDAHKSKKEKIKQKFLRRQQKLAKRREQMSNEFSKDENMLDEKDVEVDIVIGEDGDDLAPGMKKNFNANVYKKAKGKKAYKKWLKRKGNRKALRKKQRKAKKAGQVGWMKYMNKEDCDPQCELQEHCIVGPLDPKPFCVKKRFLTKSLKMFQRFSKKERKEWKRFQMQHYKNYMGIEQVEGHVEGMPKLQGEDMMRKRMHKKKWGNKKRGQVPPAMTEGGENAECTTENFFQMRTRLMGWFHVLHGQSRLLEKPNTKKKIKKFHHKISKEQETREHAGNQCKCFKSALWQFEQMDTDEDDHISEEELRTIEENTMEPCARPYLTSCDLDANGVLTSDEWCCCFAHVVPPCFKKVQDLAGDTSGYVPYCDKEGYFKREQCQGNKEEPGNFSCWCVDYNGNEIQDTLKQGRAHCSELALEELEEEEIQE